MVGGWPPSLGAARSQLEGGAAGSQPAAAFCPETQPARQPGPAAPRVGTGTPPWGLPAVPSLRPPSHLLHGPSLFTLSSPALFLCLFFLGGEQFSSPSSASLFRFFSLIPVTILRPIPCCVHLSFLLFSSLSLYVIELFVSPGQGCRSRSQLTTKSPNISGSVDTCPAQCEAVQC